MAKYTDEQKKKALECCKNSSCEGCPYRDLNSGLLDMSCVVENVKNALDIINRYEAEIAEQDQAIINALKHMKKIKAEAIKEFAERLKAHEFFANFTYRAETQRIVDILAKEMVGESK